MRERLKVGDVVRYNKPGEAGQRTGTIIGHPSHSPEHDVVVIAPDPAQGRQWEVLNDDWCSQPIGRDFARARRERRRLKAGMPRGFIEALKPGWSR